jgi:7,8-dihydroneopterin aldolase/epimerase/oxygenase
VPEERREAHEGHELHRHSGQARDEHRRPALHRVAQQREQGGGAIAGAQDVGRADVAGAVRAGVGKPHRAADQHGKRNRPGEVATERAEQGGHGRTLQYAAMDTIFIREFRVDAWVGIYEWEKQRAQTLEMEIEIGIPGTEAGRSDNIQDTVHYGEVVERIVAELGQRKFKLLEALAEHVCAMITGDFKAPWVRLSVAKLGHIRGVRKVGVTIERKRVQP